MRKSILVKRPTRMDGLIKRYHTVSQAKFVVESQNQDFTDYQREHDRYRRELETTRKTLADFGPVQEVDRDFLPNFLFGPEDVVVALGQDGLVANTLKYLDGQPLLGVNPDPERWDGVLLPFRSKDLGKLLEETLQGHRGMWRVTMAEARLADGQVLRAVNDLFIGRRSHVSYRYSIETSGHRERQSSSGIIISTGMGSTGWYRSLMTGARSVARGLAGKPPPTHHEYGFPWDSPFLRFTVREPFPSRHSDTNLVFGEISQKTPLTIYSETPEQGVIFSDGVEQDSIEFNSGSAATIMLSSRVGKLVM